MASVITFTIYAGQERKFHRLLAICCSQASALIGGMMCAMGMFRQLTPLVAKEDIKTTNRKGSEDYTETLHLHTIPLRQHFAAPSHAPGAPDEPIRVDHASHSYRSEEQQKHGQKHRCPRTVLVHSRL